MSKRGISSQKPTKSILNTSWKPLYGSPPRREDSKMTMPVRLEQFCKSTGTYQSPLQPSKSSPIMSPGCKECLVMIRMQSTLSQQLAQKQTRLSKCLRLIDDLIKDSDALKSKIKICEEQNGKMAQRLRQTQSRQAHRRANSTKDLLQHEDAKISQLIRTNARLQSKIEELQMDNKVLTNLKEEAERSQQFMQRLYNSLKAKFVRDPQVKPEEQGKMQKQLKQLRTRCSQLQKSVKSSIEKHTPKKQQVAISISHKDIILKSKDSPEEETQKTEVRDNRWKLVAIEKQSQIQYLQQQLESKLNMLQSLSSIKQEHQNCQKTLVRLETINQQLNRLYDSEARQNRQLQQSVKSLTVRLATTEQFNKEALIEINTMKDRQKVMLRQLQDAQQSSRQSTMNSIRHTEDTLLKIREKYEFILQQKFTQINKFREEIGQLKAMIGELNKILESEAERWQQKLRILNEKQEILMRQNLQNLKQITKLRDENEKIENANILLQQKKQELLSQNQELMANLVDMEIQLQQLMLSVESSEKPTLSNLQQENESLIRELYEKDLTISQLQQKIDKNVFETQETVHSEEQP